MSGGGQMSGASPMSGAGPIGAAMARLGARLAALGLLGLVGLGLWLGAIAPTIAAFEALEARRVALEDRLARLTRAAAQGAARADTLEALRAADRRGDRLIEASSAGSAAAVAQSALAEIVAAHGGDLRRVRVLPAEARGPFERVALSALFIADIAATSAILRALEFDERRFRVARLEIRAEGDAADAVAPLTVQIELHAYRRGA